MGSFAYYTGNRIIRPEKREEFAKAVAKIFYYGGMMNFKKVSLYDKEIILLNPVKYEPGKDIYFYYNYFEDASWENAGYREENQEIYSNKVGSFEFSDVMAAAYSLYEHFDEEGGIVEIDGEIIDCGLTTGWINHILNKEYSIQHRFRIWNVVEKYALGRKDYEEPISNSDVRDLFPQEVLKYVGGTEITDVLYIINGTKSLTEDEVNEESYPSNVLACKNTIKDILAKYGEKRGKEKIYKLVKSDYQEREKEQGLLTLANSSLFMSSRIIVYLMCEQLEESFWEEWDNIKEDVYIDEVVKTYAFPELEQWRKEGREKPVAPVTTSEYLKQDSEFAFWRTPDELKKEPRYYLNDADRLYWWDGSEEVIIDEETENWLNNIKEQFMEIMEKSIDEYDAMAYMKKIIDLLYDINGRYARVFAFNDMYYEFIANGYRKEYRVAIELLEKLYEDNAESGAIIEKLRGWELESKTAKCNKGRMNMKRYLSLLANPQLRLKYLGF